MPNTETYLTVAIFGLVFGSFANVLILRDTARKSILTGRSACPHCKHELSWYELIPVLSFLTQGGKCRNCHKPISWQYPLVEIGMAALFVLAAWLGGGLTLASVLYMVSFLLLFVASVIDLRTRMVPVEYIVVAAIAASGGQLLNGTSFSTLGWGLLLGAGFLALVRYGWKLALGQEGMGEGDIWLGGALGLLCGSPLIIVTLILAIFAGAILGLIGTGMKKASLTTALPFGPFLFLGAVAALLWGERLIAWYTAMSGLNMYL